MNKKVNLLCIIFAMCAAFLFGWRVMPRIWPEIRLNVINRLIPQLQSESESKKEQFLYTPKSNSQYGDLISNEDSLIYYFYKDSCPYCSELSPLMGGLPDQITLPDSSVSKVKLTCLNKNEDEYARIITEYYEEHNIPEERRYVPAVVVGNRYLFLCEEISNQLMNALVDGEGLETPVLGGIRNSIE